MLCRIYCFNFILVTWAGSPHPLTEKQQDPSMEGQGSCGRLCLEFILQTPQPWDLPRPSLIGILLLSPQAPLFTCKDQFFVIFSKIFKNF